MVGKVGSEDGEGVGEGEGGGDSGEGSEGVGGDMGEFLGEGGYSNRGNTVMIIHIPGGCWG